MMSTFNLVYKNAPSSITRSFFFSIFSHHILIFVSFFPQLFRSKLDSDPGLSVQQPNSGSASPLQHGAATLGRCSSSKVDQLLIVCRCREVPVGLEAVCFYVLFRLCLWQSPLLTVSKTGSLPRNLAATLQDIETKRQIALQQKGTCCSAC